MAARRCVRGRLRHMMLNCQDLVALSPDPQPEDTAHREMGVEGNQTLLNSEDCASTIY